MKAQVIAFSLLVTFATSLSAATTVIWDEFDSGTALTGAAVLPNNEWVSGGGHSEANGRLTLSTDTAQNIWSTRTVNTSLASPELNIFRNAVTVSIRDLDLQSFGDHVAPNARFRLGLMPRDAENYTSGSAAQSGNNFTQFYNNGNDGIAFNVVKTTAGTTKMELMYKSNTPTVTDPNNLATNSGRTLTFWAKHFDLTLTSTSWAVSLWDDHSNSATFSGTLPLADRESSWGNATDGWGNAAFIMGIQNMGATTISDPFDVSNGYTVASLGSIKITSVPEPQRALLATLALGALGLRRRRA